MPKLGVFSGAEICRLLEIEGFRVVRQRGSHIVMQREVGGVTATLPIPNHRTVRTGTLLSIIRQSGVSREKFMR